MSLQDKLHRTESALRAAIGIGFMLIVVVLSFVAFNRFLESAGARSALYNAKVARLAAESVSSECYASGTAFCDPYSESGFAPGVLDKVKTLSEASGDICLLTAGDGGYGVVSLSYTTGDYTALYTAAGDSGSWQVYKKSVIITS